MIANRGGDGGDGGDGGPGGKGGDGINCGLWRRGSCYDGPAGPKGAAGTAGKDGYRKVVYVEDFVDFPELVKRNNQ